MPRSLFWPSVWAALGLVLLLGLGTWQIERLHWKEGLIAAREAGFGAAPVDLPRDLAAAQPLEFHPVRASGEFDHAHELYLHAQAPNGDAGFDIVTPLRLADGAVLLVNRGFVPVDRQTSAARAPGQIAGPVTVTGLLRIPAGKPSFFTPDNDAARNSWFFVDPPAMAKAARVERVLPFSVDADATPNPGGWPKGGESLPELPNNHLQYAITWYALALALIAIYIRFRRRNRGERS